VNRTQLGDAWRQAGIAAGSKLLVHSSLRSLGHVEGGADSVVDSLRDVLGAHGTLLVPTLTGDETLSPANPPVFDPATTPCWTGIIPETLRRRPDAVRSHHPTHSVAAIGADALYLTAGHRYSVTPCDEMSPFGRLTEFEESYVLLVGVTHQSSTLFHHVEEVIGVPYHMQPGLAAATVVVDGVARTRHIMLHSYGTPRDFDVMEPLFLEQGIQRNSRVGAADIRLVHVRGMVRTTCRALAADPRILCRR
jgi:aminoglycoside 3-N-acetyltransferase